jgi:hypothetical protein
LCRKEDMCENRVIEIIRQSNPKKEDLEWLKEYRDHKIRFLEIQGHRLCRYIVFETLDLIDLIDFKLHFYSLEKMN